MAREERSPSSAAQGSYPAVERIYRDWDKALADNDPKALLALYAEDATIESPLIPYLMETAVGVVRGRDQIWTLFEKVAARKPKVRQHYKTGYLTDGKKVIWEYPRATPQGE